MYLKIFIILSLFSTNTKNYSQFRGYNLSGDGYFSSSSNNNFFGSSSQNTKKDTIYDKLFEELFKLKKLNEDGEQIVQKLKKKFFDQYEKYESQIESQFSDLNIDEEIQTNAKAHKIDEEIGSHTYGLKSNGKYSQILISGAKGKRDEKISSFGISEIVEVYNTALTVAYGYLTNDGHFFIDAKVNEENEDCQINSTKQLEIIEAVSDKYLLHEQKTALGITKLYRILIGKDYIKLVIQLLVAGASVKEHSVKSKSSISLENILIYKENNQYKHKNNKGYFESDNHTTHEKSLSNHNGYLLEDNDNTLDHQQTQSQSTADKQGSKIEAKYKSNKFYQLKYNVLIVRTVKILVFQKFQKCVIQLIKLSNQKSFSQTCIKT